MTEPVDPSRDAGQPEAQHPVYPPPAPIYQPPTPYQPPASYQPPAPGQLGYTPAQPPPLDAYGTPQPYPGQLYPGQPYPGQPYPGQPYPGQPYPGQPYPGQPYAGQPYPPPVEYQPVPELPRSRRRIIAIAVVVLVAVGVTVTLIATRNTTSHSTPSISDLSLPTTLADYTMLPGATADRLRSTMAESFGSGGELGKFFATAAIGTYGESTTPQLILIAAPAKQFPALDASSINGGSGGPPGIKTYPAGPHGGAVACFPLSLGAVTESICFWSDKQTVGYLIAINSGQTEAAVAALVNTARDTID